MNERMGRGRGPGVTRQAREQLQTSPWLLVADGPQDEVTGLLVDPRADAGRPALSWVGPVAASGRAGSAAADLASLVSGRSAVPAQHDAFLRGGVGTLLPEHWRSPDELPGLRGFRPGPGPGDQGAGGGRDWSPSFAAASAGRWPGEHGPCLGIDAVDEHAGLGLRTEVETLAGGGLRARHIVSNLAAEPYAVEALEVVFPLPAHATEILDFTSDGAERHPQRQPVRDGLWLRESRTGRPGHDAPWMVILGPAGFGFGCGKVWGLHVGWSGNSRYRVQRTPSGAVYLGGGELLLPGEMILAPEQQYATPWVYLAASSAGLDGLAQAYHGHLRSLPSHPDRPQPVVYNGWEAIGFEVTEAKLLQLAELAAQVGAERYVLDDGWFGERRSEQAGLGDWTVARELFPAGLGPLIERVHELGMEFGLWFEPEMVNPDSELYRAHPDWVLSVGGRRPGLSRSQLVLDLTRADTFAQVLGQVDDILTEYQVDYVKWDHNRSLVDAGVGWRAGAAGVHEQTLAFYRLLDELRRRHPGVAWEACAGGGGRIDLGVLARTERVWPSDNTDAQSRQQIQRWTQQLVPPEYIGAHVSQPFSQHGGRFMPLAFRAATALFCSFGIEWALSEASPADLDELAAWVKIYKQHRVLLHTGRVVRLDSSDEGLLLHGVVAADASAAIYCVAYVPHEAATGRAPFFLRPRGLDAGRSYRVTEITPPGGPADGTPPAGPYSGAALSQVGIAVGPLHALQAVLVHFEAMP